MQDTNNRDSISGDAKVNHVPFNTAATIARTYSVTGWSCFGVLCQFLKRSDHQIDVTVGLVYTPLLCGVTPDFFEVTLCGRCKTVFNHARSTFFV